MDKLESRLAIIRYISSEIFHRLIIESGRYDNISSWGRIFNYNSLLECVLKNRFSDLFILMYNSGIIRYDDLYIDSNISYVYHMDKDIFYDLLSKNISQIYYVRDIVNENDLREIYNRFIEPGDIDLMIHTLIGYYYNRTISRFVVDIISSQERSIKISSRDVRFIISNYNERDAVYMFSALKTLCDVYEVNEHGY